MEFRDEDITNMISNILNGGTSQLLGMAREQLGRVPRSTNGGGGGRGEAVAVPAAAAPQAPAAARTNNRPAPRLTQQRLPFVTPREPPSISRRREPFISNTERGPAPAQRSGVNALQRQLLLAFIEHNQHVNENMSKYLDLSRRITEQFMDVSSIDIGIVIDEMRSIEPSDAIEEPMSWVDHMAADVARQRTPTRHPPAVPADAAAPAVPQPVPARASPQLNPVANTTAIPPALAATAATAATTAAAITEDPLIQQEITNFANRFLQTFLGGDRAANNINTAVFQQPVAATRPDIQVFTYRLPLDFNQLAQNLPPLRAAALRAAIPTPEEINAVLQPISFNEIRAQSNTDDVEMDPIDLRPFSDGDDIVRLRSCGHNFHRDTIMSAFSYNARCPVCRRDIRDIPAAAAAPAAPAATEEPRGNTPETRPPTPIPEPTPDFSNMNPPR